MLIVATGDGKGKTTSAIGQAVRALGHGKRVFFAQFIKSETYPSGEDVMLRSLGDRLTFLKGGKGFVGILGDTVPFKEHREAAWATLAAVQKAAYSGTYDLVILDEINVAVHLTLISVEELLAFLDGVPATCDVVMTGRNANEAIRNRADFLTDCVEAKHPFHQRVGAKKGIDY